MCIKSKVSLEVISCMDNSFPSVLVSMSASNLFVFAVTVAVSCPTLSICHR